MATFPPFRKSARFYSDRAAAATGIDIEMVRSGALGTRIVAGIAGLMRRVLPCLSHVTTERRLS
jgi:hypothetical protein